MDDLLNKTRYNNLIRPATSSSQLISIQLELSLAQLISLVGAEAAGLKSPEKVQGGFSVSLPGLGERSGIRRTHQGVRGLEFDFWHCPDFWTRSQIFIFFLLFFFLIVIDTLYKFMRYSVRF